MQLREALKSDQLNALVSLRDSLPDGPTRDKASQWKGKDKNAKQKEHFEKAVQ